MRWRKKAENEPTAKPEKAQLLRGFDDLALAKKSSAFTGRAILLFSLATNIVILLFAYRMVTKATSMILVVDQTGQKLNTSAGFQEKLTRSQLEAHCAAVAYYANSFERLTITENQLRTRFLVDKEDASRVFAKYKEERAYSDAIDRNLTYKTELLKVTDVLPVQDYLQVRFTALLQIIDGDRPVKKFVIYAEGAARRCTPQYPENPAGFYFSKYSQQWEPQKDANE